MATSQECAKTVLDVVPQVMRAIRSDLRSHRTADLSIPQFRILNYISRNPQASLSNLADHIGLTLPTMSKMVDSLVAREWVTRQASPDDRRRVLLGLTGRGKIMLDQALAKTQASLAEKLSSLPAADQEMVSEAMKCLQTVFLTEREARLR
jgi:DNA-binding MarR family transcriptional regulator